MYRNNDCPSAPPDDTISVDGSHTTFAIMLRKNWPKLEELCNRNGASSLPGAFQMDQIDSARQVDELCPPLFTIRVSLNSSGEQKDSCYPGSIQFWSGCFLDESDESNTCQICLLFPVQVSNDKIPLLHVHLDRNDEQSSFSSNTVKQRSQNNTNGNKEN